MKIGEVAKRSGLAPSRIRFYEERGLIGRARRGRNGYREFPADVVQHLDLITRAQGAGFALEEIRTFLPSLAGDASRDPVVLATLQKKVDEIEALVARLSENKAQLLDIIDGLTNRPAGLACAANAERILARVRRGAKQLGRRWALGAGR